MEPNLQTLPLDSIRFDPRNPRTDAETTNLDELAASIASGGVVQPPVVLQADDGSYRVLTGERRVRAARLAGLTELCCIVRPDPGPLQAHRLRLMENLHRKELNPIDRAAALRIAWLAANAESMGLKEQASAVLGRPVPPGKLLPDLEALLAEHGFAQTKPAVTWNTVLDSLGIEMTKSRRKKLLQILAIPQDVQETLRESPVTEAAVRAISRLDEDAQRQVADAVHEDPGLARRVRRIARAVKDQGYTVDDALAEARGEFVDEKVDEGLENSQAPVFESDRVITDSVLNFIEAANGFLDALSLVRKTIPDTSDIPDPWKNFYLNALDAVRSEIS